MNPSVALMNFVSEILFHEWDPIGINHNSNIRDEYKAYVPAVCGLLLSGASESELAANLSRLARDGMGLTHDDEDRHRATAKRLIQLLPGRRTT